MTDKDVNIRCGGSSVNSRQADGLPGPLPRRGPPKTTGGTRVSPRLGKRDSQRQSKGGQIAKETPKGKTLKLLQWNCEGLQKKKEALKTMLDQEEIDIACLQETHLTETLRFTPRGYQTFRKDREHAHKGGVIILVSNSIPTKEIIIQESNESEIQGVELQLPDRQLMVYNCYAPPNKALMLERMEIPTNNCVVLGDFNSHSPTWGYQDLDAKGEEIEDWQALSGLDILNKPEDSPTFYSRAWKTTSHPDLAFVSNDLTRIASKKVLEQLATSDHKPIKIELNISLPPAASNTLPRWNYKKADWNKFRKLTDHYTANINAKTKKIEKSTKEFVRAIKKAAAEAIPRGARKDYKPNWSKELQNMNDHVSAARELAENQPNTENNIQLKKAEAEFRRAQSTATRKSWHDKTSSLNLDRQGTKLWKLVKSLNGEHQNRSAPVVLEKNNKKYTGKDAANLLIQQYKEVGQLNLSKERREEVHNKIDQTQTPPSPADETMRQPFSLAELDRALSVLKTNQSPGPDKISNEMLTHMGKNAKKKLLNIFNASWKTGKIPKSWKTAIQIPVHKESKPKEKPESYRPISLTSCLCKVMERMVNHRLIWFLERNHLLTDDQAGFRKHRSTEDQVTFIAQQIEDGFQRKEHTVAVWIDLEKAFDKVWTEGLILKLKEHFHISHNLLTWITSYLTNRRACVRLQGVRSKMEEIVNGVPQGGVLSPTLFLMFLNDMENTITKEVRAPKYADDIALLCTAESVGTAQVRLQSTLDNIKTWMDQWGLKLNRTKTTYTTFSLSPKTPTVNLKVDGHKLIQDQKPTYLGVTFDQRLTWQAHTEKCRNKGLKRTGLLKKLAGSTWGANNRVLKNTYVGYIRPVLEYGIAAWGTASESNMQKVSKIQNQNLRIITGAMRSTPVLELETHTGLDTLKDRRDMKMIVQHEKFKRMPQHPMKDRVSKGTRNRLKRSSFLHKARLSSSELGIPIDPSPEPMENWSDCPLEMTSTPQICENLGNISTKANVPTSELTQVAKAHIDTAYPKDKWNRIYTDGSATEANKDGGAGIFIEWKDGSIEKHSIPTGALSTNYKAEASAMEAACTILTCAKTVSNTVILTDARSVLQALKSPQTPLLKNLRKILTELNRKSEVVLQWIPGHSNLPGNDEADRLAKEGARMMQISDPLDMQETKSMARAQIRSRWQKDHPNYEKQDAYHKLERVDQVKIFRLRCGHNRLRNHMFHKLRVGQSAMCQCGQGAETAQHVLQDCPRFQTQRTLTWNQPTTVEKKLHGEFNDLRQTLDFIHAIGIEI